LSVKGDDRSVCWLSNPKVIDQNHASSLRNPSHFVEESAARPGAFDCGEDERCGRDVKGIIRKGKLEAVEATDVGHRQELTCLGSPGRHELGAGEV
jgi:hypothetical protein